MPTTVTVHQLRHNGACWEFIEGASWTIDLPDGSTIADALLANGPGGDWPDEDDERVGFCVRDDGEDMLDEDGDSTFVFTAGALRRGHLDG